MSVLPNKVLDSSKALFGKEHSFLLEKNVSRSYTRNKNQ